MIFTIYCPHCKETIAVIDNRTGCQLDLENSIAHCKICDENVTPRGEYIQLAGYLPFQSRDHTSLALLH